MATNTSLTFLRYKKTPEAPTYEKLVDITSYPDVFTAPAKLDATTLSNTQHTYIPDIKDVPDMVFGINYTLADFTKLKALEGTQTAFELAFGENGEEGKFQWTGDIFVNPKGGSVGAVRSGEVTCYPSTEITVGA